MSAIIGRMMLAPVEEFLTWTPCCMLKYFHTKLSTTSREMPVRIGYAAIAMQKLPTTNAPRMAMGLSSIVSD